MVDLPQVPRRLVTTEAPRNRVTADDIATPGRMLARSLGDIGDETLEIARAARNRQMASLGNRIDEEIHKASLDHAGDPEGFKKWVSDFGGQLARKERSPFMKRAVVEMVDNVGTGRYKALTTQLHAATFENAKTALLARIDGLDGRLAQMARQGESGSPEYATALDERDDLYSELERQPLYGMPPEATKLSKARAEARNVAEAVVGASTRHGLDRSPASLVDRIIGAESGGDAEARNPMSSATGPGQFIASTWMETVRRHRPDLVRGRTNEEILALRTDPALARDMTAALTADNAAYLGARGHAATPGNIYLAHFAGPAGAAALLGSDPDASAASILGEAVIDANPFLRGMSAGDVVAWASGKMGGRPNAETLLREKIWAIPDLSAEDRTRYINYGIGELDKIDAETKRLAGLKAEEYERAIIDASAGEGPIFSRSDIEDDPGLTESLRNTLLRQYDAAADDMEVEHSAYERFVSGGAFNAFDKDDRDGVEKIYKRLGGDGVALKTVVDQTGVAPPSVVTGLRGDIIATDPARLGAGLQLAANLLTANPNVFAGHDGGSDVEKAANTFRHMVENYGYSAGEAASRMAEMNTPEWKARVSAQVKGEDIDEIVKKSLKLSDLEGAFDTSWLPTGQPAVGFDPQTRQGMFGDYADLFRDRYLETGDTALAKSLAQAQLKRVWGVTGITGSDVVTRYPPEKVAGLENVENPSDLIAAEAMDSIKEEFGLDAERDSLRLLPLPGLTSTAFTSGQPVPYMLAWQDKDGIVHRLNPGQAFLVDPAVIKARQTAEREKAFREGRDPKNKGFLGRMLDQPPLPWESARPAAEPPPAPPAGRSLNELTLPLIEVTP